MSFVAESAGVSALPTDSVREQGADTTHRRILTTSRYLAQHPPQGSDTSSREDEDNPPEDVISRPTKSTQKSKATVPLCSHYFLDPMSWMREELEQGKLEGRLECPKCQSNVGKYAWQGMKCSCGAWIVPGISLARGRVDEVKARHLDDPSSSGLSADATKKTPRESSSSSL